MPRISDKFYKEIDYNNREEMIEFLAHHNRYWTMSAHNESHSYAHNMKIKNHFYGEEAQKVYELMDIEEAWFDINSLTREFDYEFDHEYQVGWNGRMNGYLVIYQGGYNERYIAEPDMKPGHRDYSDYVGRWFSYEEGKENGWIGKKWKQIYSQPGKGLDEVEISREDASDDIKVVQAIEETFGDFSNKELVDRVKMVQRFDKLCDNVISHFELLIKEYDVGEEEIQVPKKILVLIPKEESGELVNV